MIKAIALLSPIYVTLFWSLTFLIQKKSTNVGKHVLGILLLFASFLYLSHTVFFNKFYHLYAFFESLYLYSGLSLYPLYYTYILVLATIRINIPKHILRHFIPGLFFGILSLILTFFLSPDERIYYVKELLIEKNLKNLQLDTLTGIKGLVFLFSRIVFIIQTGVYLTLGIRIANKHNQTINNFFSNTEGRRMYWVKDVSIIALIISAAAVFFALMGRSYFANHEPMLVGPSIFFTCIFFAIGYKGNLQIQIKESLYDNLPVPKEEQKNKDDAPTNELKSKLLNLFETEAIYRMNDLRINTVSESLNTNRTYISRLINEEFNMNFNEFVNNYRIKEAKNLLDQKTTKKYNMEYIAEKSGFGSVASFSRVFKEFEGISPGKYRETKGN